MKPTPTTNRMLSTWPNATLLSSLFFFLLFGLSSCNTDPVEEEDIVPGPVVSMNAYPLTVGNGWLYSMRTVTTGSIASDDEYRVEFTVEADTTIEGVPCKKVRSTETAGNVAGNDRLGFRFLAHTNLGLDLLAYNGPSTQLFFKDDPLGGYDPSFLVKATGGTNGVTILDTAIHYMRFPAMDGAVWGSNEYGGVQSGAGFKRKWSGFYTVTTEAGTFDCLRLDLFSDSDADSIPNPDDLYLQQYISPQYGIIKEFTQRVLIVNGEESAFYTRETELISKNF